jgi:dGTPase
MRRGRDPDAGLAPYAALERTSRGRRHPEPLADYRGEFQRDRDRIIHSNAFRRLVYKTQVFISHEGDMYRTRLTHSIEVAQIGRSVAGALFLSEPLTEAICLAHDLGHTPFGHAGQDVLNDCMREYGGFEHNLQSLRVVDELEERYAEFRGLNLCFETREGILKHCSLANARQLGDLGTRFIERRQPGLEAQISDLADAIAYNNHDVDDGIRSGLVTVEELRSVTLFARQHDAVLARYGELPGRRLVHEIIRRMIHEVASDLIEESERRIAAAKPADIEAVRGQPGPADRLFGGARRRAPPDEEIPARAALSPREDAGRAHGRGHGARGPVPRFHGGRLAHAAGAPGCRARDGSAIRRRGARARGRRLYRRDDGPLRVPGAFQADSMSARQEGRVSRAVVPASDRLIFAMDVPNADAARRLADQLGDSITFYKLGLELFTSGGAFELLDWMVGRGKKIFLDLKLFDVPATVAGAVRNLRNRGVTFATVHGNQSIMEAAVAAADGVGILAVTVLTSLDRGDLDDLGFKCDVEQLVLSRARRALEAGCAGVVSSGLEARMLRAGVDDRLIVVTPGIRPVENRPADDQKRVVGVAEAFDNGSDYIVVGRPIRDAADPRIAAEAIQATIAGLFPRP